LVCGREHVWPSLILTGTLSTPLLKSSANTAILGVYDSAYDAPPKSTTRGPVSHKLRSARLPLWSWQPCDRPDWIWIVFRWTVWCHTFPGFNFIILHN